MEDDKGSHLTDLPTLMFLEAMGWLTVFHPIVVVCQWGWVEMDPRGSMAIMGQVPKCHV